MSIKTKIVVIEIEKKILEHIDWVGNGKLSRRLLRQPIQTLEHQLLVTQDAWK